MTVNKHTEQERQTIQFTWLTSAPLLRGNWHGILLSTIPTLLSMLALASSLTLTGSQQGGTLVSAGLFLSLSAVLIQFPAYLGRAELDGETLILKARLSGRRGQRRIPRQAIKEAYLAPLERPPRWLVAGWGLFEVICMLSALAAGWGDGLGLWFWLTCWAIGLSFWPLMLARWQAAMQVVVIYERPRSGKPGLVRAWAEPQPAYALINGLQNRDLSSLPEPK